MASNCCLAGSDSATVTLFSSIFANFKPDTAMTVAPLDVAELARLAPDMLVCDVDDADVDRLELLRRIRFVLPNCTIAVYTESISRPWGVACHLAGVNCVLAKRSNARDLSHGLETAIRYGCYTDPHFAADADEPQNLAGRARRRPALRAGLKP